MNGNDTSSKSGIFAFNGGEDEEPIELGSGEQGMRMMEKLSSSEEDNPTTIAEVEDEKENKNSKSPKNRGKNQLGKKSLDRKISKANITSKTTKIPTPMKPPPIKKVIKKKPPDKINEILEEFDKDYEEESSSYNIFKNEPQEKKSIPDFQTIASSSSSSMSANTNSTSTNPKYKNRRIFHVDSDNSEPSEPDDYDILEEVDEDQGSYVSSTRRSRGYRDNKSDDYQEKSAGRKSRSLSSLATRERSPPTNSLRNRRGRTLPRTTSESPLKHQPPPTDKIPEEEDASKLDRREKI
ncbi:unnamed protein product [Lepeophtheirus salmonis]|nr:unnamed protein product [Lepeophtheirus salmonis]CAF2957942.1 unnamed protein product [Lepeophtheirus salmonis]